MINNKKVFILYIVCFFLFVTFFIFPNLSNNTRLYSFYLKEKIQEPFFYINLNITNSFHIFKEKKDLLKENKELLKRNEFLKNVNNYLRLLTTKYNDQYKVFHNTDIPIPKSIGVKVIGDRNLTFNKSFIINKGSKNGIEVSNYVIDGNEIIGRVKTVYSQSADVVTVKSLDYGEEVIINGRSYIVTGTNNDYLSFLRKKNSAQEYSFSKDQIAIVKNNSLKLILGKINFKDNQPIIYTKYNFDLDNLRVVLND
ncbi:rod shape-determining protein MreC [Alphaproteobacteria bacterium]|nr:rod shape-determining protein MreC [Alphaproteobacteria bacterium]